MLESSPILAALLKELQALQDRSQGSQARTTTQEFLREEQDTTWVNLPWAGKFVFSGGQRAVVRELLDAFLRCKHPWVEERYLLMKAKSKATSLEALFSNHPNWHDLIMQGPKPGTWQLVAPDEDFE